MNIPENDKARYFKDREKLPMMEARPYLLKYLMELGVLEDYAKTFTTGKAFDVLHRLLGKRLNRKKVTTYYWLWTHGIALDGLKTMTKRQVFQMLTMIKENQKKLSQSK